MAVCNQKHQQNKLAVLIKYQCAQIMHYLFNSVIQWKQKLIKELRRQ